MPEILRSGKSGFLDSIFQPPEARGNIKNSAINAVISSLKSNGEVPKENINMPQALAEEKKPPIPPIGKPPYDPSWAEYWLGLQQWSTPPEEILPPTLPLETPEEIIRRQQGLVTGLPAPSGSSTSYKNLTYVEEEDWAMNFIKDKGRAPTLNELRNWSQSQKVYDVAKWHFSENDLMRQMGFKTLAEYEQSQKQGETYGPWAGSKVPEGGTVIMKNGVPWIRTFDTKRYGGMETIPEDNQEHYPTYNIPGIPGDPNDILYGYFSQQQVYEARLYDWLTQQINADAPKIQALDAEYQAMFAALKRKSDLGGITDADYNKQYYALQDEYNGKANDLMTEEKALQTQTDALSKLQGGLPADQLPYWNELQDILGPTTNQLLNQALEHYKTVQQQAEADRPVWQGYGFQQGKLEEEESPNTNAARASYEYDAFIGSLDLAQEYKYWLSQRFNIYFTNWLNSGSKIPFMQYASQILAS